MQKLWIEYDASLVQKGATLNHKAKDLELKWRKIRWKSGKLIRIEQILATKLEAFCVELDGFFEWSKKFVPNRREQASRVIAKMDPMTGKLPTMIMELRVKEYDFLRRYFEQVAHHNNHPNGDAEFVTHVEALERFLLDLLRPRTAESFSEIQRMIQEGESHA